MIQTVILGLTPAAADPATSGACYCYCPSEAAIGRCFNSSAAVNATTCKALAASNASALEVPRYCPQYTFFDDCVDAPPPCSSASPIESGASLVAHTRCPPARAAAAGGAAGTAGKAAGVGTPLTAFSAAQQCTYQTQHFQVCVWAAGKPCEESPFFPVLPP